MKDLKQFMLSLLLIFSVSTAFSQTKITGTIVDSEMNGSLPAANVTVKGTGEGASTDIDGKFSISTSKTQGEVVITFVGYTTKTISFSATSSQTVDLGTITLESDSSQLDEVVIVGRGIIDLAKDRKTPIAVSTLTSSEIQDKVGSSDITQTMVNTPSVYVGGQAGGFGDSRVSVRGFA